MKNIQVFEGNELKTNPPDLPMPGARCRLLGMDTSGRDFFVPLNDNLFSQHMLFLGSIGTGKTNGIFQIISQLRNSMTSNDVMIIFDTKGDYYNTFYRKGDIVISNDEKATGPETKDYWNIFNEIELDESMEENIIEIARTLFYEKSQ